MGIMDFSCIHIKIQGQTWRQCWFSKSNVSIYSEFMTMAVNGRGAIKKFFVFFMPW